MPTTPTTIIYQLSDDQLKTLAAEIADKLTASPSEENTIEPPPGQVVYGLDGIARLFGVSKTTALHYKNTFLAPAITQRGRKIVTNVTLAMELFNQYNKE